MAENDQQNQQDNTPKKVEAGISGKVSVSYDSKPLAEIAHAIRETNNTQREEEEISNRQNGRQVDAQERANTISNRLFWASVAMFVITAMIFWWTHLGVDAATKAADAAIRSDSISLAAYKWDSAKSAKAVSDDSIRFQKQLDLATRQFESTVSANNRTLQVAQNNLGETKKEFNTINQPFLEIDSVKIYKIKAGSPITVLFAITNIKPVTTKIDDNLVATSIDSIAPTMQQIVDTFKLYASHKKNFLLNKYVTQQTPLPVETSSSVYLIQKSVDSLLKNRIFIFISGICDFENLVTGERRYYIYQVRINLIDNGNQSNFSFIYNENLSELPIKKAKDKATHY